MLVYHGTSYSRWQQIKKEGLVPRGLHGKSNWTHSIESNPDTIYFSDAYAMNFALASLNTENLERDHAVLIEIETSTLDPLKLVPDEDALEQVGRMTPGGDGLPLHMSMQARTRHYRERTLAFAAQGFDYMWSLEALGTAGHMGIIAPSHFQRVSIIDIKAQAEVCYHYMDSQVSVKNYLYLKHKYRGLTKRMFLEDYAQQDEFGFGLPPRNDEGIQVLQLRRKA